MIPFFSPPRRATDEDARQAAVERSGLLDLNGDPVIERIVADAAAIRAAPIAALTVIDEARQAIPVSTGIDVTETSRAVSFCGHAILEPEGVFVVPDATQDPRFAGNPVVTGEVKVRFYAGAPIVDRDGHALGALCIIDTIPGEMSEDEQTRLRALADKVADQAGLT